MSGAAQLRLPMSELLAFVEAALREAGMETLDARILASSLVQADATGVATHGVNRLPAYVAQLQSGQVNSRPEEKLLHESPTSMLVDADAGFGAPVGMRTVDALMDKASQSGVALAGVTRVAHFGTAGFYTRHAARSGFLALAMSSSSPSVVPYGGRGPRIGNSPMSFAAPGLTGPELVLDMAQSTTSRGRIKLALDSSEQLPPGWAVDASGAPTTDPEEALAGGVLPSGGHKGSALSLMVEMLASGLTGANLTQHVNHAGFTAASGAPQPDQVDVTVGNFYLVIDADIFSSAPLVRQQASSIADHARASDPAPGFDAVRAPGDLETSHLEAAERDGVLLRRSTLLALRDLADRLGLPSHPGSSHTKEN